MTFQLLHTNQRKAFIKTYGCQMNEADSEKMAGMLYSLGYELTKNISEANLILLNTCCVRNTAEQKIYGKIGDIKKLKDRNNNLILGICGCLAKKEKENLKNKFPWIDFTLAPDELKKLPLIISNKNISSYPIIYKSKISAFVPIILGCNNFCSFCIVPYVRGREKSKNLEEILKEVEDLDKNNYKEVNLLGQNVISYGKDLNNGINFVSLLKEISKFENIKRIRFITSHPRDFNEEIINEVSKNQKICEYFHLPLQAGDDEILEKMNRGYTAEYYKNLIKKIRKKLPNCAISTDIIVGFPEETEEQFENTLNLVKEVEFDSAFTFVYSPRSGTKAAEFPDRVSQEVKKNRLHKLNEIQNEISLKKNKEFVGKIEEILVDEFDSKNKKYLGRTRTNKVVIVESKRDILGEFIKVKIKEARTFTLLGEII